MKKKIFVVALAVCLLAVSIVGSSMAYFTDTSKYTNVFTAGNVYIKLSELDASGAQADITEGGSITNANVYPGLTVAKNVTITNTGTEDAYVAAIIKLTDTDGNLLSVINADGSNNDIPVAIAKFLTNLGADCKSNVVVDNGAITIYLIKNGKLVAGTDTNEAGTAVIFENIVIPTSWDNDEINAFRDVKIEVTAYATQTKGTGFDTAENGIKTAFPTEFGSVTFPNP